MATPLGGRFYHVLTKRSAERVFVLRIPDGLKVLSGGVRGYGATGILSSFYDVKERAWVVHHEPIDSDAAVLLQVITLVDPEDLYVVLVSAVSLTDRMTPSELDDLRARGTSSPVSAPFQRMGGHSPGTVVRLLAPVAEGCVLTGGGFHSAIPALASSPVDGREGWGVTGAENTALTCYAIGIRKEAKYERICDVPRGEKGREGRGCAEVEVCGEIRVEHRQGGRWSIELPKPHGKFYFSFLASTAPNPVMLAEYYK